MSDRSKVRLWAVVIGIAVGWPIGELLYYLGLHPFFQ